jgi:hypothetical protein
MPEFDLVQMIQRPQRTEEEGVSLATPGGTRNSRTIEIGSPIGRGLDFCGIVERSP